MQPGNPSPAIDSTHRGGTTGTLEEERIKRSTPTCECGNYFELAVNLPQHSGRAGNSELFQPPPRACTSVTASTIRRPRIFTAVTSSERAALCAVVTSR